MKSSIERFERPANLDQAQVLRRADPRSAYIAGGTEILSRDYAERPPLLIDLGPLLPSGISTGGGTLRIGAGTRLQDILDSTAAPACLRAAIATIESRNTRNRATLGGNIAWQDKGGSLVPALLVLGAKLEVYGRPAPVTVEDWPATHEGVILSVTLPAAGSKEAPAGAAYARWSYGRGPSSLIVAAASVSAIGPGGKLSGLRFAASGMTPAPHRIDAVERLLEGRALPSRDSLLAELEAVLAPPSDFRASDAFRKRMAAATATDALCDAAFAAMAAGTDAAKERP